MLIPRIAITAALPLILSGSPPISGVARILTLHMEGRSDSASKETPAPACPDGMAPVESACVDVYEAPNEPGSDPYVMYTALEAESWCAARGKRLCTNEEWTRACSGPSGQPYPYGTKYDPEACNTDKRWRAQDESLLNTWPKEPAVREVERLWQGEPSGARAGCVSEYGVRDMVGNVEEWARRKNPSGSFRHVLKGRYWAGGGWTCQDGVTTHADQMRFYEIGFRCCSDVPSPPKEAK